MLLNSSKNSKGITIFNKSKLVYGFLFLFFSIYIFKQTLLFAEVTYELNILLAIIAVISFVINILAYKDSYKFAAINKKILYLFISIVIFTSLFYSKTASLMIIFKFIYMFSIMLLLLSKDGKKIFIFIADVIIITTLIIIVLSEIGYISSYVSQNTNWIKSYGGFINPNIPLFFIFSSLSIYFIFNSSKRYYIIAIITYILYTQFNIFARTFLYGTAILTIIYLFKYTKIVLWIQQKFIYVFMSTTIITTIILLCSAFYMPEYVDVGQNFNSSEMKTEIAFRYYYPNLIYINDILSSRLYFLYKGLYGFSDTLSGISFYKFDSIYYELLFGYGPLMLIMYIQGVFINWKEIPNNTFLYNLLLLTIVVAIVGLFDGIINKISPLSIMIFSLAIIDYKHTFLHKS